MKSRAWRSRRSSRKSGRGFARHSGAPGILSRGAKGDTAVLRCVGMFVSLWLVFVAGFPGTASAQDAVLYELVENLDTVKLLTTNHRVSHWTAQGSAQAGSPFCPADVVPAGVSSCTITAFGMDDINLSLLTTEFVVGTVWANVVAVANLDNVVDGPEAAT